MDREQSRIASNRGEHTARRHGGEAVQKQRSRHGGKGREGKKSGVRTEGLRLKVVHFGGLSRHEGQTNPVTLTLVGGRSRDRTTGETRRTSADANAVSGGKASKGRRAPRGTSFRDEEKRGEPQDRQQGETDLHGRRGETAEVVQNHAGGTRDGRQSIPEGSERSGNSRCGGARARASDSSAQYDGGAVFGNPKRGSSAGWPNRMDRDVTGKPASRSRGSSVRLFFKRLAPWS